jgi:hypothetical protein
MGGLVARPSESEVRAIRQSTGGEAGGGERLVRGEGDEGRASLFFYSLPRRSSLLWCCEAQAVLPLHARLVGHASPNEVEVRAKRLGSGAKGWWWGRAGHDHASSILVPLLCEL